MGGKGKGRKGEGKGEGGKGDGKGAPHFLLTTLTTGEGRVKGVLCSE